MRKTLRRYYVGVTSVLRRCARSAEKTAG